MDLKTLAKLTRSSHDELRRACDAKLAENARTTFHGDYEEGWEDALKWILDLLKEG